MKRRLRSVMKGLARRLDWRPWKAALATRLASLVSRWRRRVWAARDYLGMGRRSVPGLLVALLLIGVTQAANALLLPVSGDLEGTDAAITVLGTIVSFFAVATLAVTVSLTLLQAAASNWRSPVMEVLTEDTDRDLLLQTIFVSFVVSLSNLVALAQGNLRPSVAMLLPILLAIVTLTFMVGYVYERVRLFDADGLLSLLERRTRRSIAALPSRRPSLAADARPEKAAIDVDLGRVLTIVDTLLAQGRNRDATDAWQRAKRLLEILIAAQLEPGFEIPPRAIPERDEYLDPAWWTPESHAFESLTRSAFLLSKETDDSGINPTNIGWLMWLELHWIPEFASRLPAADQVWCADLTISNLIRPVGRHLAQETSEYIVPGFAVRIYGDLAHLLWPLRTTEESAVNDLLSELEDETLKCLKRFDPSTWERAPVGKWVAEGFGQPEDLLAEPQFTRLAAELRPTSPASPATSVSRRSLVTRLGRATRTRLRRPRGADRRR